MGPASADRITYRVILSPPICNRKEIEAGLPTVLDNWAVLLERAVLDQPDIVLLPEHFAFTGMAYKLDEVAELVRDDPGPLTRFLSAQACRHGMYIYASYPRRAESGAGYYNSAVLFDRQSVIAGIYDRVFPTIGEMERGILPGKGAVVLNTDFGRIGTGICFDFNFRELFAAYRRQKIALFCFLSAFTGGFQLPVMAYENQMFIASAICGPAAQVVDPLGRVLANGRVAGVSTYSEINLDGRVLHIDYNRDRVQALKQKYKRAVHIDIAQPEGLYLVSSLHPEHTIDDMIVEQSGRQGSEWFLHPCISSGRPVADSFRARKARRARSCP